MEVDAEHYNAIPKALHPELVNYLSSDINAGFNLLFPPLVDTILKLLDINQRSSSVCICKKFIIRIKQNDLLN